MGIVTIIELKDWHCEGEYEGRICGRVLTAYDPTLVTLDQMKTFQQLKCDRCKALNGIPITKGRRVARR